MLPLVLINLSRLHQSGARTQAPQQNDATHWWEEVKTALPDLSSIWGQHFYFRAPITRESLKEASDRERNKTVSIHHTVLDALQRAANPHILGCYQHPHSGEEETRLSE